LYSDTQKAHKPYLPHREMLIVFRSLLESQMHRLGFTQTAFHIVEMYESAVTGS